MLRLLEAGSVLEPSRRGMDTDTMQATRASQIKTNGAVPAERQTGARERGTTVHLKSRNRQTIPATGELISELVRRAQQNDRDAFGQLYRLHYRSIYNLARFYMPQNAEDVVAETFLRAWEAIERYRDMGRPFAAWLYAIARHIVADELKARHRVEPRDELPDEPREWEHDDRLMLAMGLARLPKTQRAVIELRYLIGLSHKEIAAILRKSVGAVKAQRWRALQNLSVFLAET